jgi:hypothetical protein
MRQSGSAAPAPDAGRQASARAIEMKRGAWRCRLHGGLSTGPKTPEGRARIAAAVHVESLPSPGARRIASLTCIIKDGTEFWWSDRGVNAR